MKHDAATKKKKPRAKVSCVFCFRRRVMSNNNTPQVSSKDKRVLSLMMATNRQQFHREEVKQLDLVQKVLSGESRCSSSTTAGGYTTVDKVGSVKTSSWGRNSSSSAMINSFVDDNSAATLFLKQRAAMLVSVKDRLRKMVSGGGSHKVHHEAGAGGGGGGGGSGAAGHGRSSSAASAASTAAYLNSGALSSSVADTWKAGGASRRIVGEMWNKYASARCRIARYNGYELFPNDTVSRLAPGEDHPKRAVSCYACGKPVDSAGYLVPLPNQHHSCLHAQCCTNLYSNPT